MAELMTIVFSVAAGIVLAGILTSTVELFTSEKTGFSLLFSGNNTAKTVAITCFLMVSGPLLVARYGPEFYRRGEPAGMSMAAAGSVSWGFVTGLLTLSIYMHIV